LVLLQVFLLLWDKHILCGLKQEILLAETESGVILFPVMLLAHLGQRPLVVFVGHPMAKHILMARVTTVRILIAQPELPILLLFLSQQLGAPPTGNVWD
jgi:hypothetical protein